MASPIIAQPSARLAAMLPVRTRERNPSAWSTLTAFTTIHTMTAAQWMSAPLCAFRMHLPASRARDERAGGRSGAKGRRDRMVTFRLHRRIHQ